MKIGELNKLFWRMKDWYKLNNVLSMDTILLERLELDLNMKTRTSCSHSNSQTLKNKIQK